MIVLWMLLALLVLAVVLAIAFFQFSCGGCHRTQAQIEKHLTHSSFSVCRDEILAGEKWVLAQPRREMDIVAFDGARLHGIFLPQENAKGTLLLFHGYRSCWQIDFGLVARMYYEMGFQLLLVDQRAQQRSGGRYITFGVKERRDVQSWVKRMADELGTDEPMYLCGLSMGASTVLMAADLPLAGNVRGIVADCGFTEPYAIMRYVILRDHPHRPAGVILALLDAATRTLAGFSLHGCRTTDTVGASTLPILFIHGKADRYVPYEMSVAAYEACPNKKELILVDGAGHGVSFLYDRERVSRALKEFLENHLPKENSK